MEKKKKQSEPGGKKRLAKVWHIFNYELRFELPDDNRRCRKGPLLFSKYIISGSDDESLNLQDQLQALRSFGLPWMLLKGSFYELVAVAGNRSRMYRGYLLDQEYQPAGNKKIALWLGMDEEKAHQVLTALRLTGLIERVPLPEFDPDNNDPPMPESGPTSGKEQEEQKGKSDRQARRTQNTAIRGAGRKNPAPFKKGEIGIGNRKSEEQKKKNPNRIKPESETEGKGNLISQALGTAKEPSASPAAAPDLNPSPIPSPMNPTESDAGGEDRTAARMACDPPPPSIDLSQRMTELYDPSAFGLRVFELLFRDRPQVQRDRAEVGAFAAAWERALQSGLRPSELEHLRERSLQRAEQISRKRRRVNKPGAVWMHEFNARLQARASPVSMAL